MCIKVIKAGGGGGGGGKAFRQRGSYSRDLIKFFARVLMKPNFAAERTEVNFSEALIC